MKASAIILAAGAGTRMESKLPKVAHRIMGESLVGYVIAAAQEAVELDKLVAVVGHGREAVIPLVQDDCEVVVQEQQRGTADAVNSCREAFAGVGGSVVVLSGDCPLITPETIKRLVERREETGAAVVVLSMIPENPFGYGRIVRTTAGEFQRIIEQKDCTPAQAQITECNSGFYCFDAELLFEALGQVSTNNAQGEYYLTDIVEIARHAGRTVEAMVADDADECLGVNTRVQLAQATKILQRRINERHMLAGVTMTDPDQVWIGPKVSIERDVELLPQTFLLGQTSIGEDSVVGPGSRLTDTQVGAGCVVDETIAIGKVIEAGSTCGPREVL